MGSSTDVHCFACGLDEFLLIGGGLGNHQTFAAWPVSCRTCGTVTTANEKASPLTCLDCGGLDVEQFDSAANWLGDGQEVIRWGMFEGGLTLTNGHYRCPRCGRFELRFGTNFGNRLPLMWD